MGRRWIGLAVSALLIAGLAALVPARAASTTPTDVAVDLLYGTDTSMVHWPNTPELAVSEYRVYRYEPTSQDGEPHPRQPEESPIGVVPSTFWAPDWQRIPFFDNGCPTRICDYRVSAVISGTETDLSAPARADLATPLSRLGSGGGAPGLPPVGVPPVPPLPIEGDPSKQINDLLAETFRMIGEESEDLITDPIGYVEQLGAPVIQPACAVVDGVDYRACQRYFGLVLYVTMIVVSIVTDVVDDPGPYVDLVLGIIADPVGFGEGMVDAALLIFWTLVWPYVQAQLDRLP